mgnify:CR=1 FL=1
MALTTQLGEVMQQQTRVRSGGKLANLFKNNGLVSAFTLAALLVLSACGGGGSTIVENDLSDAGPDGVAPTLVDCDGIILLPIHQNCLSTHSKFLKCASLSGTKTFV